jgi:CelD/BcsL family acetyltransferase involved in cellulose biosynthesis
MMLLPLTARRRLGVRTIAFFDLDVCDYAAPVAAPDFAPPREAMSAIWAAVRRALPRADLLRLPRMPALAGGAANPLLLLPGNRLMDMRCYGLTIAPPPENLIQRATRPSTFRDLAKFQRRLERRGAVAFTPASTPEEVDAMMAALIAQRGERFAEMGRYNLLDRPDIRRFYNAAAHDGLKGGPARLFGLSVEGEWVATAYGVVSGTSSAS